MSKYRELKLKPPTIEIRKLKGKKEVIFTLVSCMCDNVAYLRLKKNSQGEFRVDTYNNSCGLSFSNFQFGYAPYEIEWAADAGKWSIVIGMINAGTSAISEVNSR